MKQRKSYGFRLATRTNAGVRLTHFKPRDGILWLLATTLCTIAVGAPGMARHLWIGLDKRALE